jgi:hypothetical protein
MIEKADLFGMAEAMPFRKTGFSTALKVKGGPTFRLRFFDWLYLWFSK